MEKYSKFDSKIKKRLARQRNVWLVLVMSIILGGLLWTIEVGLGIGTNTLATVDGDFFAVFSDNLISAFKGAGNIIGAVLDLCLLIAIIYVLIIFLNRNNAIKLLYFILPIVVISMTILTIFQLPIMNMIFADISIIILIIILIMFPQELRRSLWKFASPKASEVYSTVYDCSEEELNKASADIVKAGLNMSKNNVGALIVLMQKSVPEHLIETGSAIDAVISPQLIECIFNTNADLHDGAIFIYGNRIVSAGCFLPLTQSQSLPKELGTRHRAALGVSEQYDVVVIVVREETGVISVCKNGKLDMYYDGAMLSDVIKQCYGLKAVSPILDGGKK